MSKRHTVLAAGLAAFLGLSFLVACQPATTSEAPEPEAPPAEEAAVPEDTEPSLYDRLGGVYAIAAVCDNLIDRLAANEALNANPGIGNARVPARFAGLKYQLTAMVCEATGGPCTYTGKNMKDAHADMAITASDWDLFAADAKATLDEFGVPQKEQDELFAIIGSTRGDIVVGE